MTRSRLVVSGVLRISQVRGMYDMTLINKHESPVCELPDIKLYSFNLTKPNNELSLLILKGSLNMKFDQDCSKTATAIARTDIYT